MMTSSLNMVSPGGIPLVPLCCNGSSLSTAKWVDSQSSTVEREEGAGGEEGEWERESEGVRGGERAVQSGQTPVERVQDRSLKGTSFISAAPPPPPPPKVQSQLPH